MRLAHRLFLQSLTIVALVVIPIAVIVNNQLRSTVEQQTATISGSAPGSPAVADANRAIDAAFDKAVTEILVAGAISFLFAAIFAGLFTRSVSRPIASLHDVVRSLAAGEQGRRPALAAPGEVGDLGNAVHRLAEHMEARLAALAAEQSILSSLFNALNEGVVAIAPNAQVVRINNIGRRLLSIDRPLPFAIDYLPREPTLRQAISLAMGGTETEPEEVVIGETTLSLTARPLVNGGAIVALFDLTPIRRLEAVRRDFVANVSHELRTPLTIVGGFAETLQDPGLPPKTRAEFAKTILTNTQRMQRIVDELLDLSRIESGHWQPRPQRVRVGEVATDIFARVASRAAAKQISLNLDIATGAEFVEADKTALEQVLMNLVENALRHTSDGTITIATRPRNDGVILSVVDTGSGIAPEHLPRIFERFYRADLGRSRDAGGPGLGLAIVKHLVDAHGGVVEAVSDVGVGTEIRVFFPRNGSGAS